MTNVIREAKLAWVNIADMRPAPAYVAQRAARDHRVDYLVANFDLEEMGHPTVSHRDGIYWILDGNHRIEALKRIGFGKDKIEVQVYEGLTPQQESERFLKLNDTLTVDALTTFLVGVNAGREEEVAINKVVQGTGFRVGVERGSDKSISSVGGLQRAYRAGGSEGLRRTLKLIRDAFGHGGFESSIISGLGLLIARDRDRFDDTRALKQLGTLPKGSKGLIERATELRVATGRTKYACVAQAVVEAYNKGGRADRLPPWFK